MPPRVEGTTQNQEVVKPKLIEPKPVETRTTEPRLLSETDKNLFLRQNNLGADTLRINLFARFEQTNVAQTPADCPPPPPTIDQQKVDDAVKSIKNSLHQGVFDWDVTHGDLENIQNQFRNLNAAEANAVFERLSDDDINNWTQELNGLMGSYSREEKQQLFNELAGKLNGQNLARLANAFGKDNEGDAQDLGRAIAQNASSQTKVDFVDAMKDRVVDNPAASKAVAEVIVGLKNDPAALDAATGKLSDDRLLEIMDNISIRSYQVNSVYGSAYTIQYDGELLGRMLDAASASRDPEVKARAFNAGALQLKKIDEAPGLMPSTAIIGKGDAADRIRENLTRIIDSDTEGVITELNKDRTGVGLVAYVKSMLNAGEDSQKQLGVFMSRLLTGNNNDQNQLTRFEQQTAGALGSQYYQNARTLGYFAGAIHAATSDIAKDNERRGNILKNIFDTAAGIIGAKFPVEAALGKGLSIEMVDQVVSAQNGRSFDLRDALIRLSFPVVPDNTPDNYNDNDVYTGPAVTHYEAAFDSISD